MRREAHLFERVAEFRALCEAARRALSGKRPSREAMAFRFDLEAQCLALLRELEEGTYRPRPYRTFMVTDPKPRTISAAAFRDRVVHHAVCGVMEPRFERAAITHSYACRRGKGTHRAILHARELARRHRHFLKMDVRHFFETVDHGVLKGQLRRLVKDRRMLWLLDLFVDLGAPGSPPGKGLPIGNLTSQHFANHYLAGFDHHVLERMGVGGYLRYMDDLLWFDDSKARLREVERQATEYLERRLLLEVKGEATVLGPITEGVPFLGCRIWPGVVRLDGARRRRFLRAVRRLDRELREGTVPLEAWLRSMESRVGMLAHRDTVALRRSVWGDAAEGDGRGVLDRGGGDGIAGAIGGGRGTRGCAEGGFLERREGDWW